MSVVSHGLFLLCAIGMVAVAIQHLALRRHLGRPQPRPRQRPPISILKPLCGVDDDLAQNLAVFCALDYPDYELVLGVRSTADAAYALAQAAVQRHPQRVRLVVQRGEPGLNPKVNQLITLVAAARHEILVVSDSNVVVAPDYLTSIAASFDDEGVGLVTHPVVGVGERSLGSVLDSLHLSGGIGPGMVAAERVCGHAVVVGKSMALRRGDLARIGGFEEMRDLLAEDYLCGERIAALGKRVVVGGARVFNVSRHRSVSDFVARYARWSVINRMAVGPLVFLGGALLNPVPMALLGLACAPELPALLWTLAAVALRAALDGESGLALRGHRYAVLHLLAVPLKDVLFLGCWVYGLTHDTVAWRGTRLRVLPGTWLERPEAPRAPAPIEAEGDLGQPG